MRLLNLNITLCFFIAPLLLTSLPAMSDPSSSPAQVPYPRAAEREKMLASLTVTQQQRLQLDNFTKASPEQQAFLKIFRDEFFPLSNKIAYLSFKSGVLYVALDRALFNDEGEREAWQKEMVAIDNEVEGLRTQPSYKQILEKMSLAAQKTSGPLATMAIQAYEDFLRYSPREADLPLLERLNEITAEVKNIANTSPIAAKLSQYSKESDEIFADYHSGKVSFNESAAKLRDLTPISYSAHGEYVANHARKLLAEAAIIRTKLAQARGYKTWAEYQLASKSRLFKDGYQSPQDRVAFLKGLLNATAKTQSDLIAYLARITPGVDAEGQRNPKNLTTEQKKLLMPPTTDLINSYFPAERVEQVWRETMRQSGFSPTVVNRLILDNYPREQKQTHAYMANIKSHEPNVFQVDAQTLKVTTPRQLAGKWSPAQIYIVQNVRSDSLDAYGTVFHEGGHGLDYSHRQDVLGHGQDSAWSETHSMTMEEFFNDAEFVKQIGQTRDGQKISAAQVQQYLDNSNLSELSYNRGQASYALFDILLWDHAYVEGGEDFVSRDVRINLEMQSQFMGGDGKPQIVKGIDLSYNHFATGHFYDGTVRYIGYIYAKIAAAMTRDHLLNTFEKQNGRRTLYNQPGMAQLLINGYYKRGFLQPFPAAIESFTGKTYDPTAASIAITENVKNWIAKGEKTCRYLMQ